LLGLCGEWAYWPLREKKEGKRRKRKKAHGPTQAFDPKWFRENGKPFCFSNLFIN
jgi:hypothetical protein